MNRHASPLSYAQAVPLDHRRKHGQFFTPPTVASLMADWIGEIGPSCILDPALGTGALAAACLARNPDAQMVGYEKDPLILEFLPANLSGVHVHNEDFLLADIEQQFDAVVMNPPYIRHREIEGYELAREHIGLSARCNIPRSANLYVYFILKAIQLTKSGGRLSILIPSEWMSANFAKSLKIYLISNDLIDQIVVFSNCSNVFDDALTTASLLMIQKPEHA